jgi:hypothetical protein
MKATEISEGVLCRELEPFHKGDGEQSDSKPAMEVSAHTGTSRVPERPSEKTPLVVRWPWRIWRRLKKWFPEELRIVRDFLRHFTAVGVLLFFDQQVRSFVGRAQPVDNHEAWFALQTSLAYGKFVFLGLTAVDALRFLRRCWRRAWSRKE